MRSEGFPLISGGLGVGLCLPTVALAFAAVRCRPLPSACVRSIALLPCRWAMHLLDLDFLANSIVLCRFVTCVAMMIACCVAALWKPVNVTVSFSSGRRSTLCISVLQCRGRRSILWRGAVAVLRNRSVRAAQTWHSVKSRGRDSIWWVAWKVAEAWQKSCVWSFVKMAL